MIEVTGLNGEKFVLNSNLIETIEFIPETKVSLTTGKYFLIKDTKEELIEKTIEYNKRILI